MYNVVDRVLAIAVHISFGAFGVVVSRVMISFDSHFIDTLNSLLLSITSAYPQVCRRVSSRKPLWVLRLVGTIRFCRRRVHL